MDAEQFDRLTRRLVARSSRRRAITSLAGGVLGAVPGARWALPGHDAAAGQRCKKPQQSCQKTSQCCRSKKFKCGHSHGGGSVELTCCGKRGAPCPGNALGCCIPLVCENNTCVDP